jgi:hypothetical protein
MMRTNLNSPVGLVVDGNAVGRYRLVTLPSSNPESGCWPKLCSNVMRTKKARKNAAAVFLTIDELILNPQLDNR